MGEGHVSKVLIDTNVILRYLLDDVEEMSLMAEQMIEGGAWTTPEVLAETTYVLEKIYGFIRRDISAALNVISIHVETRPYDVVVRAIKEYDRTDLDFVDCMIVGYSDVGSERVFTFDKQINRRLHESRQQNP